MTRRRIMRRRRRTRRKGNLLPFEVTITYNQSTASIVNLTAGDFNLPNNRPLGIVSYSITATSDDACAMQVTFLNGLEEITQPAMVIGRNRCRFGGRMPVVLPRLYSTTTFQIMRLNFTSKIDSVVAITIKILARPYGVTSRTFATVDSLGNLVFSAQNRSSNNQFNREDSNDSYSMPDATAL